MALPLNGPIHITIENSAPGSGVYTCVARLGGSSEVARSSNATRATALDAVIAALRVYPQVVDGGPTTVDLTLLPMMINSGGKVSSPKTI